MACLHKSSEKNPSLSESDAFSRGCAGPVRSLSKSFTAFLLLILACGHIHASDPLWINQTEYIEADSLEVDALDETVEFTVFQTSTGSATNYIPDFSSGVWVAAESGGATYGGTLPEDAYTQIGFPCLTSWPQLAICGTALVIAAVICELRDFRAFRRAQNECAASGGVGSFDAGQCGVNASWDCRFAVQER